MSGGDEEFAFVCPECAESLSVNGAMRTVLIEKGCVVCGAALSEADFSARNPPNSG